MAAQEVQQLFAALQSGDRAAIEQLTAPELTFRLAGTSRFAGEHVGRDQVLQLIGELATRTGISNDVQAVYDGPDAAIVHQRGSASGYADESLLRFGVREGRITDVTEFLFDVAAFDEFTARLDTPA